MGNIPPPAPGEPWMFALGDPGVLEEVYRRGDFLNVSVHAVPIQRRFASSRRGYRKMRNSAGDPGRSEPINEAERERAWAESRNSLGGLKGLTALRFRVKCLLGLGRSRTSKQLWKK